MNSRSMRSSAHRPPGSQGGRTRHHALAPRVLVTGAGAGPGVAVIKAIRRMSDVRGRFVVGADCSKMAAGLHLADAAEIIPRCDDPGYVDAILEAARRHDVNMVIPILDLETPKIACAQERFSALGIHLACNTLDTILGANDKRTAARICEAAGIAQPERFEDPSDAPRGCYPLIRKPVNETGAHGVMVVDEPEILRAMGKPTGDHLWQSFIRGDEYSIDTWGDPSTARFVAVPRHRKIVKAGQMVHGSTVADPDLEDFARTVCRAFHVTDVSCIQVIRDARGQHFFVEINPRYGTGVSLSIAAGVRFPHLQWLARFAPGRIHPGMLRFRPGITMIRYWEEIFV